MIKDILEHKHQWDSLKSNEVFSFISNASQKELDQILFSGKEYLGLSAKFLVAQGVGLKKIRAKAPSLSNLKGLVFPPKSNIEQCSSEFTAQYKAKILKDLSVKKVVDVTGGWGVDSWFFSDLIRQVTHVERDQDLQEIAQYNFKQFHKGVKSLNEDFESLSQSLLHNAWIYADPMRRHDGKRFSGWENHSPNPKTIIDCIEKNGAKGLLLKLSPMDDIKWVEDQLPSHLFSRFFAIEVGTELKEVLVAISPVKFDGPNTAVFIERPSGEVTELMLDHVETNLSRESKTSLYVAKPAVNKLSWARALAGKFNLEDIGGGVYKSDRSSDIVGFRRFEVLQEVDSSIKKLKKQFAKTDLHVISKGKGMSSNELQSQLKVKPKGDKYLILSGDTGKKHAFYCRQI